MSDAPVIGGVVDFAKGAVETITGERARKEKKAAQKAQDDAIARQEALFEEQKKAEDEKQAQMDLEQSRAENTRITKAKRQRQKAQSARGRSSTILTGKGGLPPTEATTARKSLLGL